MAGYLDDVEFIYNLTAEEKVEYLSSLTVFSTPAEYGESFGLYILEAAASGLPMVQPDSAAFPELFEKLDTGLLYETGDHISLASKIKECLDNYDHFKLKADRAKVLVKEEFTDVQMARVVLKLFKNML